MATRKPTITTADIGKRCIVWNDAWHTWWTGLTYATEGRIAGVGEDETVKVEFEHAYQADWFGRRFVDLIATTDLESIPARVSDES